jgi:4-amino-4-deoxy-L-arabinose transferase-like glycosyltransferase
MIKHRFVRLIPFLLALFFILWALRGVQAGNIVDTDAARHAMNGVFLRDWLASGNWLQPIEYGKFYYGRLPALSMPFHPPLFPAIEAVFLFIFGVDLMTARILVALMAGISVLLLYRLIVHTHQSRMLAAFTIVSFCFWRYSQAVASDVMLEFPAMVFTVAALYCLRNVDTEFRLRDGILFAVFAGCAVWVKQHAIFLGLVPWLYFVISRRWRLLLSKTIWSASVLFGSFIVALWLLTQRFHGTGADQVPPAYEFFDILTNNAGFYFDYLIRWMGLIPTLFMLTAFVLSLADTWAEARIPGRHLYAAWAAGAWAVLLWIGPYDVRYLFFVLPPMILLAYQLLGRVAGLVLRDNRRWLAPAGVAAYTVAIGLAVPQHFLRGPAQAADLLVTGKPRRILYCGSTDGNFIFAVRTRDPRLETIVLSGDKLPAQLFTPAEFDKFAHRFGVEYVVLEQPSPSRAYASLGSLGPDTLIWQQDIPMASSWPRWQNSKLSIYKFTNPSPQPEQALGIMVDKIGAEVQVRF